MRAKYNTYPDAQLADLYNLQDRSAFEAIYSRYWDVLYTHAKKMLGDEDQAQDAVQEVFMTLLNKMGEILLQSDFKSFLYQSTRYQVIRQIRKQKIRFDYVTAMKSYLNEGEWTTDNLIREKELTRIVELEIENLPPKMREIFEMSKKYYLSNQEIATATNTSVNNVKTQLVQAAKRVRAKFTCFLCLQIMVALLWSNR